MDKLNLNQDEKELNAKYRENIIKIEEKERDHDRQVKLEKIKSRIETEKVNKEMLNLCVQPKMMQLSSIQQLPAPPTSLIIGA